MKALQDMPPGISIIKLIKSVLMKICYIAFQSVHTNRCLEWFVKRGHEVHLISNNFLPIKGVTFHRINGSSERSRLRRYASLDFNIIACRKTRALFEVKGFIKQINPDVLHLHTLYFPSYWGLFAGFHPILFTPWNGDILWQRNKSFYYRYLVHFGLRKADAITVDNHVMRDTCLRYGAAEDKICVTRWYGADVEHFHPKIDGSRIRDDLWLGDSPVVLSTRSLTMFPYNIDVIVESLPLVLKEVPEAKFVFIWHATTEEDLTKIKDIIARLKIQDAVRLVGKVEDYCDVPRYYSIADAIVSIASPDSTPASLFEAMACGVPPVVSDIPAITEFIKDGWNGYVVPPRDHYAVARAIVRLLKDSLTRRLFAERNLELVREKANYQKEMSKMEALYYKLIEKV